MDKMTKRLINEAAKNYDKSEVFHSSGYAQAQQGKHIGAAGSGQTFKQRQKMVREFVGSYSDAKITQEATGRRHSETNKNMAEPVEPSIGAQRWADMQAARAQKVASGGAGAGGVQPPKK